MRYTQQFIHERVTITEDGCWEWQLCRDKNGYGLVTVCSGEGLAHRLSYRIFKGSPVGLVLRHTCDNPSCCNPDHLEAGTQTDNLIDMRNKGRGGAPPKVLSEEQVAEILHELSGITYRGLQRQLAHKYRVAEAIITKIKQGKY